MSVVTKQTTAEELLELSVDGTRFELDRGELVPMSPVYGHSEISANIYSALREFAKHRSVGKPAIEAGFQFQRQPDTVLVPDVSFISADQIPSVASKWSFVEVVPKLVFEVVSPSDRADAIEEKVVRYLGFGVELVVLVWPRTHRLTAHRQRGPIEAFERDDIFRAEDVLPEFQIVVSEVFA